MGLQLGKLIGIDFAIQFLGWALSVKFRTERHFDLTGSLTFILLTYLSRNKRRSTLRQNIQSSCVFFWALSGIPILERQAMKLFASNPAYQAYRKRTPILIPFLNFPRI
ncbi:unnamed protein product [Rotaria magnacalcarata]|uniref:Uncharacterized protein n=1 Tax=Rotaria magnacalcarata TaxID=392030 RepID=A0A8S2PQ38_9BILA|nr:unnamed protein product [Rotaria magnacalcarata]